MIRNGGGDEGKKKVARKQVKSGKPKKGQGMWNGVSKKAKK
jgi:hypothetical protein